MTHTDKIPADPGDYAAAISVISFDRIPGAFLSTDAGDDPDGQEHCIQISPLQIDPLIKLLQQAKERHQ